ncbi:hypothetical protein NST12_08405 [Bacillus sp. FSL W8-1127]|uniref:hypothetical protein n=1 Tax=Bacillus TaxID=1386 RepID=UPI002E215506|nr:hypothetical protein [Bacillus smithii]MED1457214.1 hypothetical protein [Bacillus smithii]
MSKTNRWKAFIIFVIIMILIYKFVPTEYKFISIVLFPIVYWFIYDFFLATKHKRD